MTEELLTWKNDLLMAGIRPSEIESCKTKSKKWLETLRKAVAHQRQIRRLVPEETWELHRISGAGPEFEEIREMRKAFSATRLVWSKRPKSKKKHHASKNKAQACDDQGQLSAKQGTHAQDGVGNG